MVNIGTLWVVINASEAQMKLVEFIDSGDLAEAAGFSSALDSLIEKMKKFVQQYGGSIPIYLYERIVMQLPSTVVEQIPDIVKGYSEALNNKVAIGIGLTMQEASLACQKSVHSGDIELFEPEDSSDYDIYKSGIKTRRWKSGVVLPPNIFDPTMPDEEQYKIPTDEPEVKTPTLEEAMAAETKLIEAVANQLGMQEAQQQMEEQKATMEQQMQAQQPPRDLLETLNGGPVDGHEPEEGEEEQAEGGGEEQAEGEVEEEAAQIEEQIEEAEESTSDDKIAMQLDNLKGQIPQIMGLAQKDPKAFQQTMNMINKLIQLAHSRSKSTKKSETRLMLENAISDLNKAAVSRPKSNGIIYPVGTRLGRYKKVVVDGHEVWREFSSGVMRDTDGSEISVKESNRRATENQRDSAPEDFEIPELDLGGDGGDATGL